MPVLRDRTIRELVENGKITIDPFDKEAIQPSSIDVRLDRYFRIFVNHGQEAIDPYEEIPTELVEKQPNQVFVLQPGEYALGSTYEVIGVPDDLVARVEGKSSLGRLGLLVHTTAGFIDPGFVGHITLELLNVTRLPIRLHPGMRICQIAFMTLDEAAEFPYGHASLGSKYQGQRGPTASMYFKNRENHLLLPG